MRNWHFVVIRYLFNVRLTVFDRIVKQSVCILLHFVVIVATVYLEIRVVRAVFYWMHSAADNEDFSNDNSKNY